MDTVTIPSFSLRGWFRFHARRDKQLDGRIHLFMHEYNPDLTFWYGYAHIDCTLTELFAAAPRHDEGGFPLDVDVLLEDYRHGTAHIVDLNFLRHPTRHITVGLVGCTPLAEDEDDTPRGHRPGLGER